MCHLPDSIDKVIVIINCSYVVVVCFDYHIWVYFSVSNQSIRISLNEHVNIKTSLGLTLVTDSVHGRDGLACFHKIMNNKLCPHSLNSYEQHSIITEWEGC